MTFLKFDPMRHFDDIASKFETALNQACDELKDGKWKLSFAKQYDQVKWSLPENIELKNVKSVSFKVADQKGSVTLKVYNGGDDATQENTKYPGQFRGIRTA